MLWVSSMRAIFVEIILKYLIVCNFVKGAEWLAVYGTPCLYSWAESLENLEKCFTDNTLIDTSRLMNDSAFRNVYWACYSTTLGSLLHEFSHILDIGHNLSGIMARGFDDLYRLILPKVNLICYYLKLKL